MSSWSQTRKVSYDTPPLQRTAFSDQPHCIATSPGGLGGCVVLRTGRCLSLRRSASLTRLGPWGPQATVLCCKSLVRVPGACVPSPWFWGLFSKVHQIAAFFVPVVCDSVLPSRAGIKKKWICGQADGQPPAAGVWVTWRAGGQIGGLTSIVAGLRPIPWWVIWQLADGEGEIRAICWHPGVCALSSGRPRRWTCRGYAAGTVSVRAPPSVVFLGGLAAKHIQEAEPQTTYPRFFVAPCTRPFPHWGLSQSAVSKVWQFRRSPFLSGPQNPLSGSPSPCAPRRSCGTARTGRCCRRSSTTVFLFNSEDPRPRRRGG